MAACTGCSFGGGGLATVPWLCVALLLCMVTLFTPPFPCGTQQSLMSTIVNLAQNFVGSNNLNLLLPIGQFGTRLHGGKDAASARCVCVCVCVCVDICVCVFVCVWVCDLYMNCTLSPRYIYTKLSPLARLLFPAVDDNLFTYQYEDNMKIEPEWYCPILPMVLVNGCEGIGTGFSTNVPNYDVREIVTNLKALLAGRPPADMVGAGRGRRVGGESLAVVIVMTPLGA